MMAAYIGAVLLVMGYLVTASIVGQKIEYRETFARWEPLGNGALREAMRYWTQSEMNSRLVDLSGTLLFSRIWAVVLGVDFLGITVWRFSMTERAPSKRRLRRLAKREASEARSQRWRLRSTAAESSRATARPSSWAQFMIRLRVEMRKVLTSPGLIVLALFAIGNTAAGLWLGQSQYGTSNHPTLAATVGTVRGGFSHRPDDGRGVLRRRTGLARARPQAQRDDRFDAGPELGR